MASTQRAARRDLVPGADVVHDPGRGLGLGREHGSGHRAEPAEGIVEASWIDLLAPLELEVQRVRAEGVAELCPALPELAARGDHGGLPGDDQIGDGGLHCARPRGREAQHLVLGLEDGLEALEDTGVGLHERGRPVVSHRLGHDLRDAGRQRGGAGGHQVLLRVEVEPIRHRAPRVLGCSAMSPGSEQGPGPADEVREPIEGSGFAVANLEGIGEGYGFRKIRRALGVEAFGVNAIVLPPGYDTGRHYHDRQQELYFVHSGRIEFEFGDGSRHLLGPGGVARVDAATVRKVRNVSSAEDAVYVIVGAEGGYVGRDGRLPEGETSRFGSGPPPEASGPPLE
jgi:mannose-6-phosphate isomerase-like protein (cupin superfamily)